MVPTPRVSKLDLKVMDILWTRGTSSAREIQESFPERDRPAYRTVQTTVYRLETEKAVRRVRKIRNAHLFEATVSRAVAQRRLVDDLVGLFGRRTQHVIAHLIESGKLTHDEVREADRVLRTLAKRRRR